MASRCRFWDDARVDVAGENGLNTEDLEPLRSRLAELKEEHRALDDAIHRLAEGPFVDQIRLTRLKKRKLQLRDVIARLESRLIPDLNA
ncbi:hypothetical protein ECTPHS_01464 [Ectothiorhodospira sp. PHS-1]|uniref:YdcH family protein n=1 Tax=Ectothiorhodospira sp. PHS-1 TaxID=519989 RepID=UPI00024A896E|nr:hypothetical protein ECTPHS_01464 [Ectothiorhodospira sp. PHS-1]